MGPCLGMYADLGYGGNSRFEPVLSNPIAAAPKPLGDFVVGPRAQKLLFLGGPQPVVRVAGWDSKFFATKTNGVQGAAKSAYQSAAISGFQSFGLSAFPRSLCLAVRTDACTDAWTFA